MSALDALLPSGGAQNVVEFVASGTLSNGQAVILNSNGSVTAVAGGTTNLPQAIPKGSLAVLSASTTYNIRCAFDPTTKGRLLIIYKDSSASNYLTAVIGTVSGASISFAAVTQLSNTFGFGSVSFDPNTSGKFIVGYQKGGNPYGIILRVGTVSGTNSISFGAEVTATTFETSAFSISYDPNTADKFILAASSGSVGTALICSVTGNSIYLNSTFNFNGHTTSPVVRFNPATANQVILSYTDNANSQYGTARICTVSGTSLSYATEYVFSSQPSGSNPEGTVMDASKTGIFVVAWGTAGKSIIGTISGTAISYGSVANFISAYTQSIQVAFDPVTTNRFVVSYEDSQNSNYGTIRVGTVSGSTISYAAKSTYVNSPITQVNGISFDPNASGMFATAFGQANNSFHGKAVISQLAATVASTNLTATNLIGISAEAIASGATGKVNVLGGLNEGQSSLTPASIYYVQSNGTITTASASPAQKIGQAISSTKLNLVDL